MRTIITFIAGVLTGAAATSAAGAWLFHEELEDAYDNDNPAVDADFEVGEITPDVDPTITVVEDENDD